MRNKYGEDALDTDSGIVLSADVMRYDALRSRNFKTQYQYELNSDPHALLLTVALCTTHLRNGVRIKLH